jgi:glycosyltransferase involved in cell wall biosynthesis
MGRHDPVKGHGFAEVLFRSLHQRDRDFRLTMTGQPHAHHEGVTALGWVSEAEKNHLLQSASLLLVPSDYEGQPMVMLEALSCGLPVCVSDRLLDVPPTVEVATYGDVNDWMCKVKTLLEQPPDVDELLAASSIHRPEAVSRVWGMHYDALLRF